MRFALLLVVLAACGNPDNLVIGGISSYNGSPPVILNQPASAIHGQVTLTNPAGKQATAIVLSSAPDLCTVLGQHHDFFQHPTVDFAAVVLIAPPDKVGTFNLANPNDAPVGSTEALAGHAGTPTQAVFPAFAGYAALTNLDYHGEATGSFDLVFATGQNQAAELSGRYKTHACDALTQATLP